MTPRAGEHIELGWVRVAKVFDPASPSGFRIAVEHSARLPVYDLIAMLDLAARIEWEQALRQLDD